PSLLDAGIAGDVGDPERLSRLPHLACRADARRVTDIARFLDEPLDVRTGGAPGLTEPQHPGLLVRTEVPADVPAFGIAYRANDRLQADRRAVAARDVPDYGVLQRKQLLFARALRAGGRLAHAAREHGKAGALELALGELGVALDIFYHDDSEFLAHRPS